MAIMCSNSGCEETNHTSKSGITEKSVSIQTDLDGYTVEQRNIADRLKEDNKAGSIKHLYVISAYSGQVLIYSTVKGKVTSSGKRLTSLLKREGNSQGYIGVVDRIQDDGTFGNSVEYLYWWDSKGIYHQHYVTGGAIVHISNQPISVKSVTLNLETSKTE